MQFVEFVWYIIAAIIIFGLGFITSRFIKAWQIGNMTKVGKIIFDGDDIYLRLDGIVDWNELRKNKKPVVIGVADVSTKHAEKTAANME